MTGSLYVDALTGLDNLLALVMADINVICGDCGMVLYADSRKLKMVNEKFGLETGDMYIATCAEVISRTLLADPRFTGRVSMYRVSGDDFITIIKGLIVTDINDITDGINNLVHNAMLPKGIQN